jgi:hypothetical protein
VRKSKLLFAILVPAVLVSCQTPEQLEGARERAADLREKAANAYFPPEMEDNVWLHLGDFKEPNLFVEHDSAFQSRYRLSISGISCKIFVIRIDERISGEVAGKVSHRNKCKNEPAESHFFRPSVNDFEELKTRINVANMFKFYPEVWNSSGDEICLDGNMLIFERRTLDGYSVSSANAQCEAPHQLHQVAQHFVAMSGEKGAAGLLR